MKEDKNEEKWDRLLRIRTTGRDDSHADQYRYPYEPTPYSVLERLAQSGRIRKKQVLGYSDLGIYRLLFGVKDRRILEQFMESVLGALIQYDARNHTDYLDVLRRYLLTECSIQQTAEQMQVHRNTINYKLRQIREILQTDLNQEARVKIYLAYLIRDML